MKKFTFYYLSRRLRGILREFQFRRDVSKRRQLNVTGAWWTETRVGAVVTLMVFLALAWYQKYGDGVATTDVLVEAWGLLFDAVLFGFLIVWLNDRRAKRERIRRHLDELEDYFGWEDEEGVRRSAGALRRLGREGAAQIAPYPLFLNGGQFEWAELRNAQLANAKLVGANFQLADLSGARLSHADLSHAILRGASIRDVTLENASLEKADLSYANFAGAQLRGASLKGANLEGTKLRDALHVSQAEIDQAFGNHETQLPDGLQRPSNWWSE